MKNVLIDIHQIPQNQEYDKKCYYDIILWDSIIKTKIVLQAGLLLYNLPCRFNLAPEIICLECEEFSCAS